MEAAIECQQRPEGRKPNALRREGLVPAALYGHKGTESISLVIDARKAMQLLKYTSVNNTLVDVKIPHLPWQGKALIREVQTHPWKPELYHISFFAVSRQESVQVTVPINLVGESKGVKEGGVIEQVVTELGVQCRAGDIPESIDIDVTDMEVGTTLHVSELDLPEGVEPSEEPGKTVMTIVAPSVAPAPEEPSTEDILGAETAQLMEGTESAEAEAPPAE